MVDDEAFRAFQLENPKEAIRQASGMSIPEDFTIQAHEENNMTAHLAPPSGRLTEADLELVAGGDSWGFSGR